MRYFLEFAYNGQNYFGWQKQPRQVTVQGVLENAVSTILRENIGLTGAGRTDTGVHARQMFAHFDRKENLPADLLHRLNAFLPGDIAVYGIHPVLPRAHARFDALERTYHYFIETRKNPFNFDYAWQIRHNLDAEKMNLAAASLLGKQDFSSFAKLHTDVKTHICEVKFANWEQNGPQLKFTITADRFLRNMVRSIVGTLTDVGKGKTGLEEFNNIIAQKDRSFAGSSAPAQGLYLVEVVYPKNIFLR